MHLDIVALGGLAGAFDLRGQIVDFEPRGGGQVCEGDRRREEGGEDLHCWMGMSEGSVGFTEVQSMLVKEGLVMSEVSEYGNGRSTLSGSIAQGGLLEMK